MKLRRRGPLELVAMLLALCGIGLLGIASVAGLRETHGGRGAKVVASPIHPRSTAPTRTGMARSVVAAHRKPVKGASRLGRSTTKAATGAPRTRAPGSATGSPGVGAPAPPIRRVPTSAPKTPAPAAPEPQAAPTPQATPKPQAAPKQKPKPGPKFDERGTTPGSWNGSVPFDDSGGPPAGGR